MTAFAKWFYSAMLNFKTQMTNGKHETNRDSVISRFLAPAYILASLGMFYNYLEDPQIDVDWEVLVNMKVNKYISTNLVTQLIYDKDQVDEVQFKEIIGIGLTYKF